LRQKNPLTELIACRKFGSDVGERTRAAKLESRAHELPPLHAAARVQGSSRLGRRRLRAPAPRSVTINPWLFESSR
jgi:hypothetical protein